MSHYANNYIFLSGNFRKRVPVDYSPIETFAAKTAEVLTPAPSPPKCNSPSYGEIST